MNENIILAGIVLLWIVLMFILGRNVYLSCRSRHGDDRNALWRDDSFLRIRDRMQFWIGFAMHKVACKILNTVMVP